MLCKHDRHDDRDGCDECWPGLRESLHDHTGTPDPRGTETLLANIEGLLVAIETEELLRYRAESEVTRITRDRDELALANESLRMNMRRLFEETEYMRPAVEAALAARRHALGVGYGPELSELWRAVDAYQETKRTTPWVTPGETYEAPDA